MLFRLSVIKTLAATPQKQCGRGLPDRRTPTDDRPYSGYAGIRAGVVGVPDRSGTATTALRSGQSPYVAKRRFIVAVGDHPRSGRETVSVAVATNQALTIRMQSSLTRQRS